VRDTEKILDRAGQLLDFTKPVAISLLALLHAVPGAGQHDSLMGVADRMIQNKITYRSREQLAPFFDGTDLVEPGIVRVEEWRQEPGTAATERSTLWGAVARKR
jgi:hypothetical protein